MAQVEARGSSTTRGCVRDREIGPRTWYAGTPEPDRHDSQPVGTALFAILLAFADPITTAYLSLVGPDATTSIN